MLRDTLRSPNPSPCVIDALLPSVLERKDYIDATTGLVVPIRLRCFYSATPVEVASHNSLYRAVTGVLNPNQHQRVIAPEIYQSYQKRLVVPTKHEGATLRHRMATDGADLMLCRVLRGQANQLLI